MSRAVTIELDVDDAQAVKAWQRGKQAIAEFDKQGGKAKQTFGDMFANSTRGMASAAAGFIGVGSAIGGIVTVATLLRNEYDSLLQRQSQAAATQLTLSGAERQLALNVGGDPFAPLAEKLAQQQQAISIRDRIVAESGATPLEVTNALSGAFSARGNASLDQAGAAVSAAVKLAPSSEDIDYLAAGSLDLVRSGADPGNAAAFLASAGSQLRLTKTKEVGENTAKAVNLLGQFGNDERESAALFGLLTKAGTDPEGRSSVTAALQFAGQVRALAPTPGDTFGGLEQIVSDPKLKAKFLKDLTGEQRFKPTFEALVNDPSARAELFGIRDALPSFADSERLLADQSTLLGALPTAPVRNVQRGFTSATESLLASDPSAISSVIRDRLPEFERSAGGKAISSKLAGVARELESGFGENPIAALGSAVSQLSAEESRLRRGKVIPGTGGQVFSGFGTVDIPAQRTAPTNRDIQIADVIQQLVETLNQQRETVEVSVKVNNRAAPATIKTPAGPRKHSRLNSPPVTAGGTR
jgi:hypothetical protein